MKKSTEKERIQKLIEGVKGCRDESVDLRLKFVHYILDMALVELKNIEAIKGYSDAKRVRRKPL